MERQMLFTKVGEEYLKMTKYETDENGGNGKVYDAVYEDKTGELLWVEREENTEYVHQIGQQLFKEAKDASR